MDAASFPLYDWVRFTSGQSGPGDVAVSRGGEKAQIAASPEKKSRITY
jgi:hypothetical protein